MSETKAAPPDHGLRAGPAPGRRRRARACSSRAGRGRGGRSSPRRRPGPHGSRRRAIPSRPFHLGVLLREHPRVPVPPRRRRAGRRGRRGHQPDPPGRRARHRHPPRRLPADRGGPRARRSCSTASTSAARRSTWPTPTRYAAELAPFAGAPLPDVAPAPDDLYLLIFTSGSTGAPKAVRFSQGRAARAAAAGVLRSRRRPVLRHAAVPRQLAQLVGVPGVRQRRDASPCAGSSRRRSFMPDVRERRGDVREHRRPGDRPPPRHAGVRRATATTR